MSDPQTSLKQWLAEKVEPRLAKSKLSKATGISMDKITRSIELADPDPKKRRQLKQDEIAAIARFYGELPPGYEGMTQWLESQGDDAAAASMPYRPSPNASFPPVFQEFPQGRRIPLMGQSEAGPNGRFIMNGQKVADVFCPPGLENVPNAYAVRVYGTSMEPRYRAGETVWLNPQLPVRAGDDVVVQLKPEHDGDEMASYIKEFRSRSSKVLRLWQHNPEEGESHEIELDNAEVFSVHAVVYSTRY